MKRPLKGTVDHLWLYSANCWMWVWSQTLLLMRGLVPNKSGCSHKWISTSALLPSDDVQILLLRTLNTDLKLVSQAPPEENIDHRPVCVWWSCSASLILQHSSHDIVLKAKRAKVRHRNPLLLCSWGILFKIGLKCHEITRNPKHGSYRFLLRCSGVGCTGARFSSW